MSITPDDASRGHPGETTVAAPPATMRYTVRLESGEGYGPADIDVVGQWAQQGRVPPTAMLEPDGGGSPIRAADHPRLAAALAAPPTSPGPVQRAASPGDDAVATIIPFRNPPALAAYYLAIASLLPGIGFLCGLVAVVLGVIGLRRRRNDPKVKGAVHAWIGILGGGLLALLWGAVIISMIIGAMAL